MQSRAKTVFCLSVDFVDLKQLILNHPEGIKEDEYLIECYPTTEKDLEELKKDEWIRVITSQKEVVLFPINKDLTEIEVRDKISSKTKSLLSDIWSNEVMV